MNNKRSCVQALKFWLAGLFVLASGALWADELRIAWLTTLHPETTNETSGFWTRARLFGEAAAEDLGIDLHIVYGEENHLLMQKQVDALVALPPQKRPQALMLHNYKRLAAYAIPKADAAGIPVFLFNSGLSRADQNKLGKPREKHRFWIAQMLPDDRLAGNRLMAEMDSSPGEPIKVVAIQGTHSSTSSAARHEGLLDYIRSSGDVNLVQSLYADWSRNLSQDMTLSLFKRYPDVRYFWAANDNMALGVMDAARGSGRTDIVTGGVDWLDEALAAVREGRLKVSMGGHFTEPALVLVLLKAYLEGADFAERYGTILQSEMLAFTPEKARVWGDLRERFRPERVNAFDFRQLADLLAAQRGSTLSAEALIDAL